MGKGLANLPSGSRRKGVDGLAQFIERREQSQQDNAHRVPISGTQNLLMG